MHAENCIVSVNDPQRSLVLRTFKVLSLPVLSISGIIDLFEAFQVSPACPSDKCSMKIKTSKDHWAKDTG
jgi:hypothetical protein